MPSNNTVTDRTDLTPDFDGAPTVVEQADGSLLATPAAVRGGTITSTLQWLRCDAAGQDCQEVAGATGSTYAPTIADRGFTTLVRQRATNAAGAAEATSSPLWSIPATVLTAARAARCRTLR